jgi:hypothetical protein
MPTHKPEVPKKQQKAPEITHQSKTPKSKKPIELPKNIKWIIAAIAILIIIALWITFRQPATPSQPVVPVAPVCGNDILEEGEECDGEVGSCKDYGFLTGVVRCIECAIDTSDCSNEVNGTLKVASTPDGDVTINGIPYGSTPLTVSLSPGAYEIAVEKEGFATETKSAAVQIGEEVLVELSLEKQFAQLIIKSFPSGAIATIEGERVGVTPVNVTTDNFNEQVLGLFRAGYHFWTTEFRLNPGDIIEITAVLNRK